MGLILKIAILLLFNALGFLSISLVFFIGQFSGTLELPQNLTDIQTAQPAIMPFFQKYIFTWMVCGLFSISFLFMKGLIRIAFLLAPLIIPLLYGLSVLFLPDFS